MTVATLPTPRTPAPPRAALLALGFAACAAAALAAALRAPLATTVLGLIAFGVLHNVLELRYVAGRFAHVLTGRLLWTALALVTAIVGCRLLALRVPEIVLCYGVLAAGLWHALPRRWLAPALAGLAVAAAVSLSWPAYHFVVLAHLHNVVPLFFLWEWSRRLPGRERAVFRAAQLGWVLVVPALLLAGVFDPLLADGSAAVVAFAGTPESLSAPVTPPGLAAGLRFLAVFAFLQAMHYVVWLGFLPRYAPDAAAAFEQRVPWLSGWRPWALGAGAALVLGVLFLADYGQGRTLYQAFASYHAYLEFPVLLALLFGVRR
ncbi:hypothetical protein ACFQY4_24330 [Catellatospora bangladeshensis]|uniref:Beta-carotene 15,15'-monooxygenase n=1 Tax=Catellatospora bangladeshensis TaxID=310355 RepID=A0A8J3JN33_9ACTN|nr:hypothetical protein [Catellatospora bangladeshensis]GIF80109.1 hypothetical protein Cba03nite_14580 [Catellatospora bangladeshensis]